MIASATSPRAGYYRGQTAYTTTGYATGDTAYVYRVSPFTTGYDSWSRLGETYAERRERDRKAVHEAFYHSRVSAYPGAIERASWLAERPVRRAPPLLVAPRSRSRVGIRGSGRRMTWRTRRRQRPSFPTSRH